MLQHGPRPYSGKHRALCMIGSRMGASDSCFTRQSILESTRVATWSRTVGVPTNGTIDFVSAPHLVHAGDSNTASASPCVLLCAPPAWMAEQAHKAEQVEHTTSVALKRNISMLA